MTRLCAARSLAVRLCAWLACWRPGSRPAEPPVRLPGSPPSRRGRRWRPERPRARNSPPRAGAPPPVRRRRRATFRDDPVNDPERRAPSRHARRATAPARPAGAAAGAARKPSSARGGAGRPADGQPAGRRSRSCRCNSSPDSLGAQAAGHRLGRFRPESVQARKPSRP